VCEALAAAGLGHAPVRFDAEAGVYLRRYVPGRAWSAEDLQNTRNLERLAELLRRVHALPPAGRKFKPLKAAGRYARQIGTAKAGNLFGQAATAYALAEPATPALCHNDLFCGNVIESDDDGLALIDWEYAGIGDPFFDLAVVVRHHELAEAPARHFLGAYLGREVVEEDMARLGKQCRFYAALLALWNLRINPPAGGR
jgi:thiamine kinase-like enzyme